MNSFFFFLSEVIVNRILIVFLIKLSIIFAKKKPHYNLVIYTIQTTTMQSRQRKDNSVSVQISHKLCLLRTIHSIPLYNDIIGSEKVPQLPTKATLQLSTRVIFLS